MPQVPRNLAFDTPEMRHGTWQMLRELRLPPLLILHDAIFVAQSERVRIEASVPGLGFEKGRCLSRLDLRFFKKHVQVEQITALETLQNTP